MKRKASAPIDSSNLENKVLKIIRENHNKMPLYSRVQSNESLRRQNILPRASSVQRIRMSDDEIISNKLDLELNHWLKKENNIFNSPKDEHIISTELLKNRERNVFESFFKTRFSNSQQNGRPKTENVIRIQQRPSLGNINGDDSQQHLINAVRIESSPRRSGLLVSRDQNTFQHLYEEEGILNKVSTNRSYTPQPVIQGSSLQDSYIDHNRVFRLKKRANDNSSLRDISSNKKIVSNVTTSLSNQNSFTMHNV
jgi:hypothetical protein